AVGLDGAAVDDELGTVGHRDVDVGGHPVAVLPGDERPHVGAAASVPDPQAGHPLTDLGDELVGDRLHREHHGDRHAAFTGGAVAGVDGGVGDEVEVGVGQHEHVVLRTAQRLHPLAVRGGRLV